MWRRPRLNLAHVIAGLSAPTTREQWFDTCGFCLSQRMQLGPGGRRVRSLRSRDDKGFAGGARSLRSLSLIRERPGHSSELVENVARIWHLAPGRISTFAPSSRRGRGEIPSRDKYFRAPRPAGVEDDVPPETPLCPALSAPPPHPHPATH